MSQYDVALLQNVEAGIGLKLGLLEEVAEQEEAALRSLNKVSEAQRSAKLKLESWGFDEMVEQRKQRRGPKKKKKADKSLPLQSPPVAKKIKPIKIKSKSKKPKEKKQQR